MPTRKLPPTGTKFGEWTFLGEFKGRTWHCLCSCGKEGWPNYCHLKTGASKSCHGKVRITHGRSGDKIFWAWSYLKQRCLNVHSAAYPTYGGVGINIEPAWIDNFEAFVAEIGEPPSDLHTVDRIKNNLGYVKGNVRWATSKEQARNRRTNHWITIDGVEAVITDWCAFTGANVSTAVNRIKGGWLPAEAVGLYRKEL